jgi:hypothetical protein
MKKISLLVVLILLGGCTTSPSNLGISDAQWAGYSKAQRQEILHNYRKIDNTAGLPIPRAKSISAAADSTINVAIHDGKIMMPPFTAATDYLPIVFTIHNGHCKRIVVHQANQAQSITLDTCYQNKILYLDPSRYDATKSKGSLLFNYTPFWEHGFTYQDVSSTGYAQLSHVDITIQSIHE